MSPYIFLKEALILKYDKNKNAIILLGTTPIK